MNCLSVFDHFVGLALKGLNDHSFLERLLAANNPLTQTDRPHQLFADAPPLVPPPTATDTQAGATSVPPVMPPPIIPPPMSGRPPMSGPPPVGMVPPATNGKVFPQFYLFQTYIFHFTWYALNIIVCFQNMIADAFFSENLLVSPSEHILLI